MSLSFELANRKVSYDPESGKLTWKERGKGRVVGTEAGSTIKDGRTFYRQVMILGSTYKVHRVAWTLYYGAWPELDIDHENGDGLDNRITNLKLATGSQNMRNSRKHVTNTSGHTGVVWHKHKRLWQAQITVDDKSIYLGMFVNKEDAISARVKAEQQYSFSARHGK